MDGDEAMKNESMKLMQRFRNAIVAGWEFEISFDEEEETFDCYITDCSGEGKQDFFSESSLTEMLVEALHHIERKSLASKGTP